ncbi:uncharacterized protein LOC128216677 [Mya arenaria]|uniref:uncharacterized protein LOC128216677 n=1 Tax=Mya arenaria TaxID=6604 RepID=UPI0022E72B11|nr:uncharacterized protein LOC128216677 [Mya arenaria]
MAMAELLADISDLKLSAGSLDVSKIGARFNQWVKPIAKFTTSDSEWLKQLRASPYIGEIDFGSKDWARSREAVDYFMDNLLIEMRKEADKFEHIKLESYVRQGSSRDGLKVIAPDEYDTVVQFHIQGTHIKHVKVTNDKNETIPGFCYMQVHDTMEKLEKKMPRLYNKQIFEKVGDVVYVNTKNLHERVLTSIVDKATLAVEATLKTRENVKFSIRRKKKPPAINITLLLNDEAHEALMKQGRMKNKVDSIKEIDLDIVPALKLSVDDSTRYEDIPLNCPIHAVCKWVEGDMVRMLEFIPHKPLIWHVNSSSYERHMLDVARTSSKGQCILTALRIMKTYFVRTKAIAKENKESPQQLVSVLKSYNLKQIAFYEILFACHLIPTIPIENTQQALQFFVFLLETSLSSQRLPHFFYSNSLVSKMFSGLPAQERLKYNLFRKAASDSLVQALKSLQNHCMPNVHLPRVQPNKAIAKALTMFKSEIERGPYF